MISKFIHKIGLQYYFRQPDGVIFFILSKKSLNLKKGVGYEISKDKLTEMKIPTV